MPMLPIELYPNITDIRFNEPETPSGPTDITLAKAYIGLRTGFHLADVTTPDDEENQKRLDWLWNFYKKLLAAHPKDQFAPFRFEYTPEGSKTPLIFRGKRMKKANGGVHLTLRRIPQHCPTLVDLNHPPYWHDFMMAPPLTKGGLVLICAPTGNGKTTTLDAMWSSRLRKFAGVGVTVEEPVEIEMDGDHGEGECIQTQVDMSLPKAERYPAALADILTAFPTLASGGGMLMLGELRDPYSMVEAFNIAQTGILVAGTIHGSTVTDAVQRGITLAQARLGSDRLARELMASVLRLVINQRLILDPHTTGWKRGTYTGNLYFHNQHGPAGKIIREDALSGLGELVARQNDLMKAYASQNKPFAQVYGHEHFGGFSDDLEFENEEI